MPNNKRPYRALYTRLGYLYGIVLGIVYRVLQPLLEMPSKRYQTVDQLRVNFYILPRVLACIFSFSSDAAASIFRS